MTEDEVNVVAAELARAGGLSWYPEQATGPLKVVLNRYRKRARMIIAALDRHRQGKEAEPVNGELHCTSAEQYEERSFNVGGLVLYRPPGDRRSYTCRIEKIDGNRAYITPSIATCTGWIELEGTSPIDVLHPL